jgi:hypothetical protein
MTTGVTVNHVYVQIGPKVEFISHNLFILAIAIHILRVKMKLAFGTTLLNWSL